MREAMRTITKKTTIAAAALGAAALLLTGCSGGEPGDGAPAVDNGKPAESSSTAVWDFENTDAVSQKESIEFVVSEGLLDVATDYAENRLYDSVTLTGLVVDDPAVCAVRYDYAIAPGVDMDVVVDKYFEQYAQVLESRDEAMKGVLGFGSLRADLHIGKPNLDASTGSNIWISEDLTSATRTAKCAKSPYDPDVNTLDVWMSETWANGEGGVGWLAKAELTVMSDGGLTVLEDKVSGFVRDSNGEWIAD